MTAMMKDTQDETNHYPQEGSNGGKPPTGRGIQQNVNRDLYEDIPPQNPNCIINS